MPTEGTGLGEKGTHLNKGHCWTN